MNSTRWLMLVSALTLLVSAFKEFPFPTKKMTADVEILKTLFQHVPYRGIFDTRTLNELR